MPSFVLELEVSFSQKLLTEHKNNPKLTVGGEVRLKRILDTAAALRNTAKSEALKRLHKVRHDKRYQALQAEYARRKRADRKAADRSQSTASAKRRGLQRKQPKNV